MHSVTDQSGRPTTFSYANGELTSVTDFAGRVSTYGYTGGQLTSLTLPDPGHGEQQHVTTMGYDANTGMLTTVTDAGGTTTLAYNSYRQVTRITDPDNNVTQYAAPSSATLGSATLVYTANVSGSVTDGNNHTSTYTVDPDTGDTLSTTDATGTDTTSEQYNNAAQVTQITQPPITSGGANLVTSLHYDGCRLCRNDYALAA